jgi:hypothetical protein
MLSATRLPDLTNWHLHNLLVAKLNRFSLKQMAFSGSITASPSLPSGKIAAFTTI